MAYNHEWPYSDIERTNTDWEIMTVKDMKKQMDEFTAYNQITFANPIEWDSGTYYKRFTIVLYTDGNSYIAMQDVPIGIPPVETMYWARVADFNAQLENAVNVLNGEIAGVVNMFKGVGVTPEMFGAVGDGDTDDTIALQTAVNASNLVVLSGSYKISGPIALHDGLTIIGGGTVIIDGTFDGFQLADNVSISNITFTDTVDVYTSNNKSIITGSGVSNVFIEYCTFNDIHTDYGIFITASENLSIRHNVIDTYNFAGIVLHNGCINADIEYNKVHNGSGTASPQRYPICFSAYHTESRGPAQKIKCNYNVITDTTPYWEGIDAHGCINCEIRGNIISGTASGIMIGRPTSAPVVVSRNITIADNSISTSSTTVADTTRGGIMVRVYNGECIKITNNRIKINANNGNHQDAAISIHPYNSTIYNVEISNNEINSAFECIYTTGLYVNLAIANNDIGGTTNNKVAINLAETDGFHNISVTGNFIAGVDRGIGGPTVNASSNSELIHVADNKFGSVTEKYRTFVLMDSPIDVITVKTGGQIGDFVPNDNPASGTFGWVCTVAADLSTSTKATWKAIACS